MGASPHAAVPGVHTADCGAQLGDLSSSTVPRARLRPLGCPQPAGGSSGSWPRPPVAAARLGLAGSRAKQQSSTVQDSRDPSSLFHQHCQPEPAGKCCLGSGKERQELGRRNLNQFLSCQHSSHLQRHCELTQITIPHCLHAIQVSTLRIWSQASLQLAFFITASK